MNVTKVFLRLSSLAAAFAMSGVAFAQCPTAFSAWSASSVVGPAPGPVLTITPGAAMRSTTCGMQLTFGSTPSQRYVQDDTPEKETRYRARFFFDPNSAGLNVTGPNHRPVILRATVNDPTTPQGGAGADLVVLRLAKVAAPNDFRLFGFARVRNNVVDDQTPNAGVYRWKDSGGALGLPLVDGPNVIEFEITTGAAGNFKIWINANSEAAPTAQATVGDNSAWKGIDQVRLGSLSNIIPAVAVTGSLFFDEFESRRQTFIGN
jgi:hypothetical protein